MGLRTHIFTPFLILFMCLSSPFLSHSFTLPFSMDAVTKITVPGPAPLSPSPSPSPSPLFAPSPSSINQKARSQSPAKVPPSASPPPLSPDGSGLGPEGGRRNRRKFNVGVKVGLAFLGAFLVLQLVFGGFLMLQKRRLRRVSLSTSSSSSSSA